MRIEKRTIKNKIIIGFCLLCTVCITLALLFLERYYANSSEQYLKANLSELGTAAARQIDSNFDAMDSVIKTAVSQDAFLECFSSFAGESEDDNSCRELLKLMSDAYKNRNTIRRMVAINAKGQFLSTGIADPDEEALHDLLAYAGKKVQTAGNSLIYYPLRQDYMDRDSKTRVFTCIFPVFQNSRFLGYLLVQQNEMYYENAIHFQLDNHDVETIILWDDTHVLYTSCDPERTREYIDICRAYTIERETQTELFDIEISAQRDTKCLFSISKSATFSRLRGFYLIFIAIMLVFAVVSVVFIIIFVGQLTRPMRKLVKHMSAWNIDEEQNTKIDFKTTDYETAVLLKTYQEMIVRQKEILDANKKLELLQERTLFSALQSEISPHFLFNTLDGIAEMCEEEGAHETANSCYDLAIILRYASSYATDEVLLSQEIENLKAYLKLLKVRYRNRIEYSIKIEEKCDFLYLPKLTLQPLVENAVKYSIAERESVRIEITAGFYEEYIYISIRDNGSGITDESIQKTRMRMEKIRDRKDFQEILESIQIGNMGLTGTLIRLKLFYKESFDYELQNVWGGTRILLKIQYRDFM